MPESFHRSLATYTIVFTALFTKQLERSVESLFQCPLNFPCAGTAPTG
jgi:hypothetical protein